MKLEELQNEYLKKYSYSTFYKKYFEIGVNKKYFPIKRITIIIFTFLFFFLISYKFTLPKLENESLYIFAAQVTIIALIFPIILTLIGILYSKNNNFDTIFKVYISNTNAATLYRGSFILLLFYVISFFYLYDADLSEQIRRSLNTTLAIMFIDAIIISLFFLEKTISFTTNQGANKTLIEHYINNDQNDESINILNIISSRLNDNIKNNDLNSYEENLNFMLDFIDIIIIMSTTFKDGIITSDLNKNFNNDLFSRTKLSQITSLIEKNIKFAINSDQREYYLNIKSIYFSIFIKNYKYLEPQTIKNLQECHKNQCFILKSTITNLKPKLINDFVSSWYKWIKPYIKIDINLLNFLLKNHLRLTVEIIDIFSKDKNFRGLDYFCDCLSRWESEAKNMPNYIEPESYLKTIFDIENSKTLANLVIDHKLISFYLIQKEYSNNPILLKFYSILIKGETLFKTIDFRSNSYAFSNLDEILLSYLRVLINSQYKDYFNDIIQKSNNTIEITGLIHGGWTPPLESSISDLTIQLLLIETAKKTTNLHQWKQALQDISLAKMDKIIDLIKRIYQQIESFNNYNSLQWNQKKLIIYKTNLLAYITQVTNLVEQIIITKYQSIQLNEKKINQQIFNNTFFLKDLENFKNKTIFSPLITNDKISYKNDIKIINQLKLLPSKYLTTDYDIHLDNIFKPDYYYFLIDLSIFKAIDEQKSTEFYFEKDSSLLLIKILLRSYIFSSPIVFFRNSKLLSFILNNINKTLLHTYKIESKENNRFYKIGKTIFKYTPELSDDRAYITPSNIIKHINFDKITPETLSSVHVNLSTLDSTQVEIYVKFPIEITLVKNSQVIEIFIKE
ncbi:hypothetical protein [Acinetobacter courvalinii]|uniref:Uncharacterized protein n=1 Tax=Acinetobacter courvalinii TaxID=280147 RepID=A0AA42I6V0_9GAMM|nr:hypothetical protein [Acinetobacter courvalinii]MDH0563629.1 hypothetical protein [Acinetobacter courvalinii]